MTRSATLAALVLALAPAASVQAGPVLINHFAGTDTADGGLFTGFVSYDTDTPGVANPDGSVTYDLNIDEQRLTLSKNGVSTGTGVILTVRPSAGGGFELFAVGRSLARFEATFPGLTSLALPSSLAGRTGGAVVLTRPTNPFVTSGVITSVNAPVAVVPEPSTLAGASLAGVLGLGYAVRRRRAS